MPSDKRKILVVEDEGLIARDIASRLERMGHTVVATCGTADEALDLAPSADLVLMDIRLDGRRDGIAAAAEIRERYHLPVVFLTGQSDFSTVERAKLAEPFGYIVKPLAPAALQTSIEIAIYKHRMERELSAREAWLRTLFGAVADAVVVADANRAVLMLNRSAEILTGWTQAEAAGKPLEQIVHLIDDGADPPDPLALAILRDEPVALSASARLISRTGRQMAIEGAAAPVKAPGLTLGAVLTLRDVSARRWEERQLRQSEKLEALGRLSAEVSNEYTALLSAIRARAENLLHQFGEYSPARNHAEAIQQAASEAERLNRRLAALGTRQVGETEVLSLNGLIRRATRLMEAVLGPAVELSLRLDPAAGRVRGDREQLDQVLMGLTMHCASSMHEGGRLLIETRAVEIPQSRGAVPHTLLALTHTGHEPNPEKIFEPASVREEGMALSMIHAIVTEHGGYLSAQPTQGEGCRFEVIFPAVVAALAPAPRSVPGDAPAVLFIEPHDAVRLEIHNYFESRGFNLLEAADLEEAAAIAQVHDGKIDLIISASPDPIPGVDALHIVEGAEHSVNEIRRPFTEQALFERAEALVKARRAAHA